MIRQSVINNWVFAITLMAIFAGMFVPKILIEDHLLFFSFSLILAGIPHGASDFLLFKKVSDYFQEKSSSSYFYIIYALLIGNYLLVWYYLPVIAFLLFLLISVYHFGQSNWNSVLFKNKYSGLFTTLFWGSAIVGIPILIYFDQAALIISEIVGEKPVIQETYKWALLFILVFGNIANIGYLAENNTINIKQCKKEIANFLLLVTLFFTTPLLVGFGIYFVFWHSVTAVMDQYQIIRLREKDFSIKKYLRSVLPLSGVAFAGLIIIYLLAGDLKNVNLNLGILFLFISVITVPHAILMDLFYKTETHQTEKINA